MRRLLVLSAVGLLTFSLSQSPAAEKPRKAKPAEGAVGRTAALRNSNGTYDAMPRTKDHRLDVDKLLSELSELKVNTYNYLVWQEPTDWDDLHKFLPKAREKGLRVWITLVPPSESPPHTKQYSEPFKTDYTLWAVEIAKLSVAEPNLVAWSVDDFAYNHTVFSPANLKKTLDAAHEINPKLAFVPCIYYKQLTPDLARQYGGLFDGVLMPYRHEGGKANLTDTDTIDKEIARYRELLGPKMPVIVDVYATGHSQLGPSTAAYVEQVMKAGHALGDGVHIYCHQPAGSDKYAVMKKLFNEWATEK